MKTIQLIFLLLFTVPSFSQYKVNTGVKKEFDSLFNRQPKDIQSKRFSPSFKDGFGLVLSVREDTLNANELQPREFDSTIKIIDIDPITGEERPAFPRDTTRYNLWMFCQSTFQKDTLNILSHYGLFSGFSCFLKLLKKKSLGQYNEYSSDDSIYRQELSLPKSDLIFVRADLKEVLLNSIPKKLGDTFYGKITMVTEPFYVDDSRFINGFILKRYIMTYLFTSKIVSYKEYAAPNRGFTPAGHLNRSFQQL